MATQTRLQEIRKGRGISATDLARHVGVTRQTIYAIENGSFVPNTTVALQLARTLDVTVEQIFSIAEEPSTESINASLLAVKRGADEGELVRFCRVNGRLVAIPVSSTPAYLPQADGIIKSRTRRTVLVAPGGDIPENGKRLLLAGCDPALSMLNQVLGSSETEFVSIPCSSGCALKWLAKGSVHVAGSHLLDHATGDYNLPIIRRLFRDDAVRVVTFATWEQGIVLQRGNPKDVRSIADLGNRGIKIINREKGSGSRDILDSGLRASGIPAARVKGYSSIAEGHLAAAHAVLSGVADCCVAPRSAARCFGLDFVPLAVERFDLSFTQESLELPAAKALLDLLTRSALRKKLQTIAGYDTAQTGQVLI